jgi:hypothetical protein
MTRERWKVKGRADRKKRFALIPAEVIDSENWAQSSKPCRALVVEVAAQYSGHNNGDLTASVSRLQKQGWRSRDTLKALRHEAEHYGLLVQTKQGGLHLGPTLLALGWQRIDACNDARTGACKLDDPGIVGVIPGGWRTPQSKFRRPAKNKLTDRRANKA